MKEFFIEHWTIFFGVAMYLIGYIGGYSSGKLQGRREMYHNFIKNVKLFIDEHKEES